MGKDYAGGMLVPARFENVGNEAWQGVPYFGAAPGGMVVRA